MNPAIGCLSKIMLKLYLGSLARVELVKPIILEDTTKKLILEWLNPFASYLKNLHQNHREWLYIDLITFVKDRPGHRCPLSFNDASKD